MQPNHSLKRSTSVRPHKHGARARSIQRRLSMPQLSGGCLCGSIRFELSGDPVVSRICWCRDCQKISSNGTVNVIFPTSAIEITGKTSEYTSVADSGNHVRRRFCPTCGSHLFADNTGRPGLTVVRVGTLDEPSSISPNANIWASRAPAWACFNSELQRFERQPQQLPPSPSAA